MRDISKLDHKRSYGIVTGDPNVRYMQDGHAYGHDEKLYVCLGGDPPVPPPHEGTQVVKTFLETEKAEIESSEQNRKTLHLKRAEDRKESK